MPQDIIGFICLKINQVSLTMFSMLVNMVQKPFEKDNKSIHFNNAS